MNNIYVDELPKSCDGCCFNNDSYCVNNEYVIENYFTQTKHPKCPLKPLSVALAEERKRVVQEIRKWCKENFDYTKLPNELGCWVAVNREEFFNILDQIERGE